jgi:hypothetical protein
VQRHRKSKTSYHSRLKVEIPASIPPRQMAEAVGLVLGVIGTYNTCLAAHHLISGIVHHKGIVAVAACKLSIERGKFWNWGLKWGLAKPEGIKYHADVDLDEELKSEYVRDLVVRSLDGIEALLTDAEGLVKRYGLREESAGDGGNYNDLTVKLKSKVSELGKVISFRGHETRYVGPVKRIRWTIMDEGKFEKLVEELLYFNNALYQVLPVKQRQSLAFALPSVVLARKNNPQTLNAISQASITTFSQPLAKASSIKELSINLDHQTERSSIDNEVLLRMKLERSWLQIPMTLSDGPRSTKQSILQRLDGQKQRVLVEWSQLNPAWSQSTRALMLKRFDNTAQLLRSSSSDPTYGVLDCAGIVEEPGSKTIGIISYIPEFASKSEQNFRNLGAWINKEDDKKPNLGDRFAFAQKLALSVHQIHTSGWLHKNIRSTNIAFFSNTLEEFNLDSAYMIGFGKARPDNDRPDAQTVEQLDVPGSSFDKYLPPIYQTGGSRYRQAFDVYSFGVLLVEIARWEPNPVARKQGTETMQKFHRRVRQTAEQILGEEVGAIYQGVVLRCLDRLNGDQEAITQNLADFEMDSDDTIESDDFGKPMDDNEWFYWNVINPLEQCKA